MRRPVLVLSIAAILVGGGSLVHCAQFIGSVCDIPGVCSAADGGGEGSTDAKSDVAPDAPPGCDLTKDPKDAPACISEVVGIFVAPNGNDTSPGTKMAPMATIGKAMDKAIQSSLPRVYVCEGSYGALAIDAKRDGVAVFGGFGCNDWTPKGAVVSVASPDNKPALTVTGTTTGVLLADLQFISKNAMAPGESSVAALVSNAKVRFRRARIEAGTGMLGAQPMDISDFMMNAANGKNGDVNNAGGQTPYTCANGSGSSTGAVGGGPGGASGVNGQPYSTYPVNPANADGKGGTGGAGCFSGGVGHDGSYGPGGGPGAGAVSLGVLTDQGWAPAGGGSGGQGKVGEGGGGGASITSGGGGGGGGPGGCGGDGAAGGGGGGASIALALVNSTATVESSTLVTKNAGDGGKGGKGQKAQGAGGAGSQGGTFNADACPGGTGGHGGSGGGGGGGAGGASIGIAWKGTAPTIDGSPVMDAMTQNGVTVGQGGMPGPGGDPGPPFKANAPASNGGTAGTVGAVGVAQAVKSF